MIDHSDLKEATNVLERLVSFKSISRRPTQPIVDHIVNYLRDLGVEPSLSFDNQNERANIFATIGPNVDGGVVLNGHLDVVPVAGQEWSTDPFKLTAIDDKLYGRGSVDMKGFLACVLASVPMFLATNLQKPIHIAFSFDEEIGGLGMPHLLQDISSKSFRPEIVIVGEPTDMKLVTGHKGGFEMRTEITGHAVHSSDPRKGVNAIEVATKFIAKIEQVANARMIDPIAGSDFDPPYATFNVGTIEGGASRNTTAGWCNFNWEYRSMPGEDGHITISEITKFAQNTLYPSMISNGHDGEIRVITEVVVPALDDSNASAAVEFVHAVTGTNHCETVSFGTDAGYFSDQGFSTVVIGPGDINRAHKADEFITRSEINQGLDFLSKIALRLAR